MSLGYDLCYARSFEDDGTRDCLTDNAGLECERSREPVVWYFIRLPGYKWPIGDRLLKSALPLLFPLRSAHVCGDMMAGNGDRGKDGRGSFIWWIRWSCGFRF